THIWIEDVLDTFYPCPVIKDFSFIKSELINYKTCKGDSVIDCQPFECGRNGNKLYELSIESGVNVIAVTGFHKRQYYPRISKIWKMSKQGASDFFIKEIQTGLEETINSEKTIKASAIKIAFIGKLEDQYLILTEAALAAAAKTDRPIIVHTEKGHNIELLIDFLKERKIDCSKVLLCHMDKRNDFNLHRLLAHNSFYLEYDTFLRQKYNPEENAWPLLINMIKNGYYKSVMIGSDISGIDMWRSINKNFGLGSYFNNIKEKLFSMKIGSDIVDRLVG
ncbi:unnamed protein product, partial [marine sediment metagenome]